MTCATPCHGHTHRQGRRCECDTNATRATFNLAPLHQQEGGHTFSRGVVFPLTDDPQPEVHTPTPTPIRRGGLLAALRRLLHI